MKNGISKKEILLVVLQIVFLLLIVWCGYFVADCNGCIFRSPVHYDSPGGTNTITIKSSTPHFLAETKNVEISAGTSGSSCSAVERQRHKTVVDWEVKWIEEDEAVITIKYGWGEREDITVIVSPEPKFEP